MDLSISITVHDNNEPHWRGALELVAEQVRRNFSLNNELVEEFEEAVNYSVELIEYLLDAFHLLPGENNYHGVFTEETEEGTFEAGIFELDENFDEIKRISWLTFR